VAATATKAGWRKRKRKRKKRAGGEEKKLEKN